MHSLFRGRGSALLFFYDDEDGFIPPPDNAPEISEVQEWVFSYSSLITDLSMELRELEDAIIELEGA